MIKEEKITEEKITVYITEDEQKFVDKGAAENHQARLDKLKTQCEFCNGKGFEERSNVTCWGAYDVEQIDCIVCKGTGSRIKGYNARANAYRVLYHDVE